MALHIIDSNAAVCRAYFGTPPMADAAGRPINAVSGYLQILHKILLDAKGEYILSVWDAPGKNIRHQIDATYKANRPQMDQALRDQIPVCQSLTAMLGIPCVQLAGYEADDLIASYALATSSEVVIHSADKDLMALVDERVIMMDDMRGIRYDADAVRAKWGVQPAEMPMLLALMGDAADNIKGVAGIGKKRAAEVVSGKRMLTFEQFREYAAAMQLVELHQVGLPIPLDCIYPPDPGIGRLEAFRKRLASMWLENQAIDIINYFKE